jgi:prevent-host-death family protein
MSERKVGVRELKARLSEYLRHVKEGDTIVITEHGRMVGRIVPAGQSLNERLKGMLQSGLLVWNGKKLEPMAPVARVRGKRTVSDLLVESRD